VESEPVELTYFPPYEMTVDIFAKPLSGPQFQKHVLALGLTDLPGNLNGKSRKLNAPGSLEAVCVDSLFGLKEDAHR